MRRSALSLSLLSSLVLACGGSSGDDVAGSPDAAAEPANSFRVVTADVELAPGVEKTFCYYTTLAVDRDIGVKQWSSVMSAGSHHLIMYSLPSSTQPDGTMTEDCSLINGANLPVWTYSAQTPEQTFAMPAGIGVSVKAQQKVVIQLHYFNASDQPITAHAEITGEYYGDGEAFTPAAPLITFNTEISIPAGVGQTASATGSCAVPAGAKFFALSTHAHKRAVLTRVTDRGTDEMVFESDNWEHPGAQVWAADPFYSFTGNLNYRCDYVNDRDATVTAGDSADTDEMCMAVGWFFPATDAVWCINSFILP